MTTGENKARTMLAVFNAIYNKRGISFSYTVEGQYIVVVIRRATDKPIPIVYRAAISYNRFVLGDEELNHIYNEIEEALADTGMLQGVENDLIKELFELRRYINVVQDQLKEYEEANLELKEKIELQDSLIQELRHIIETNGMNTRKRG